MAFRWNFRSHAFCLRIFTKMCSSLEPQAYFWKPMLSKMPSKMLVLSHFWLHLPFQSPSAGPSSATKNQKKCCSREGLEHFFDLRPFFNHNLQFIFAISVTCFKKFDFWCLLAWFFFNFCKNYKNVLPALGGKHIFEKQFLQLSCARSCFHTQIGFKTTTYGRAFPRCAVQIILCFAEWAENGPLSKLCSASLLLSHAF